MSLALKMLSIGVFVLAHAVYDNGNHGKHSNQPTDPTTVGKAGANLKRCEAKETFPATDPHLEIRVTWGVTPERCMKDCVLWTNNAPPAQLTYNKRFSEAFEISHDETKNKCKCKADKAQFLLSSSEDEIQSCKSKTANSSLQMRCWEEFKRLKGMDLETIEMADQTVLHIAKYKATLTNSSFEIVKCETDCQEGVDCSSTTLPRVRDTIDPEVLEHVAEVLNNGGEVDAGTQTIIDLLTTEDEEALRNHNIDDSVESSKDDEEVHASHWRVVSVECVKDGEAADDCEGSAEQAIEEFNAGSDALLAGAE